MRMALVLRSILVMCAVGLWGCGGSGGGVETHRVIPEGHSEVSFIAGGDTGSAVSHGLEALLDSSATGTGSGAGVGGPTSIYDHVAVTCTFRTDSLTNPEQIQIIDGNSSDVCANANECIVCTPSNSDTSACSLACYGVVPSTPAVAANTFGVFAEFTSTIVTDMPDPYGTIRFDVSRTGASFILTSASGEPDVSGCTYDAGVAHELGTSDIAPATWFTNTADAYRKGMTITNLDPDPEDPYSPHHRTHCAIITTFATGPTLLGADIPGASVEIDLGAVTFKSKICDYTDATPVAQHLSDCTAQ